MFNDLTISREEKAIENFLFGSRYLKLKKSVIFITLWHHIEKQSQNTSVTPIWSSEDVKAAQKYNGLKAL